jgi:predicted nucleic acid-binding protein
MGLIGHRKSKDEIDYERQRRDLEEKIAELQNVPEQLELEMRESDQTLPPLEDLAERERQRHFEEQAARGQIRNERRTQGRSVALMILLLAATAAVTSWIIQLAHG